MRLAGITTIEEANAFLPGFIERFNARFAVDPQDPEPAFLPRMTGRDLETIICIKEDRQAKCSVISYSGRKYKLVDQKGKLASLPPRAKVQVLIHLDDSIEAMYQEKLYSLCKFEPVPAPQPVPAPAGKNPRAANLIPTTRG
jgi:hypothetical protein